MKKELFQVTVGSDPEVFVMDAKGGLVPACGLIGAKKGEPKTLPTLSLRREYRDDSTPKAHRQSIVAEALERYIDIPEEGAGGVVEDNVMVEFNPRPCSTVDQFIYYHWMLARSFHKTYLHDKNYQLSAQTDADFGDTLKGLQGALEFGCDRDYCVYLGDFRPPVQAATLGGTRFAGGHIHIGYDMENTKLTPDDVAVLCDLSLGLFGVIYDSPNKRREYYGQAGVYRVKSYGIEYRSVSNFWLRQLGHTHAVAVLAFTVGNIASTVSAEQVYEFMNKVNVMLAREAIDTGNKKLALEVIRNIQDSAGGIGIQMFDYSPRKFGNNYDNISLVA